MSDLARAMAALLHLLFIVCWQLCCGASLGTAPIAGQSDCTALADIIFVIDSTASINALNYGKLLQFAANLTENFQLGPNNVRFGALLFGDTYKKLFDLKTFSDHKSLSQAILSASYLNQGTNLAPALTYVKGMFNTANGGRDKSMKITIVMTDGRSIFPTKTHQAADVLKQDSIKIVSIGIGKADMTELAIVASGPDDVFHVPDFTALQHIEEAVASRTCEVPVCAALADIMFVIDSTASIKIVNYRILLQFAANLTENFQLGPNNVRFGALLFGDSYKKLFDLNTFSDHRSLSTAILNAQYLNQGTNLAPALTHVKGMFNSANGGRDKAKQIVIVMTDGFSQFLTQTNQAADVLKKAGILMVSIGIGKTDLTELATIASGPNDVFHVPGFTALQHIEEAVASRTCEVPCAPVADIIFLLDSSGSINLDDNNNYHRLLQFASNLTETYQLGPNGVRFGAVIFSTTVRKLFDLKEYSDHASLSKRILAADYLRGHTNTASALSLVKAGMFDTAAGGRSRSMKIVIVITDGRSDLPSATQQAAQDLKDAGVAIIAVGISAADKGELNGIASSASDVFEVHTFEALQDLVQVKADLTRMTCETGSAVTSETKDDA